MLLSELQTGDKVTLEVIWGTAVYPLNAVIYRPVNDGIYIRAFYKNDQLLDFSNKTFRQASYNLYAYLENGGTRIVWKNVTVEMKKIKTDYFYMITVSTFAKNSTEVNRRTDSRVKIFGPGLINIDGVEVHSVLMKDISNSGVAFTIGEEVDLVGRMFDLEFSDEANGHKYQITAKCRAVRMVEQDHGYLVGCSITEGCKDLIFYVYYKMLAHKKAEQAIQILKNEKTKYAEKVHEKVANSSLGMRLERNRR